MSARFVLLAGCLGRRLNAELESRGATFLATGNGTVCKPLLICAGQCVLDYWLKQIEECPRLQNRAWIVVNKEHLGLYQDWAQQNNFPRDRLVCNGVCAGDDVAQGDAGNLALAIPEGNTDWIFCARADYVFEPEQSLRHFVESAFITQRLTIAMTRPSANAMEAGLALETSQDTDGLLGDSFTSNVLINAGNTVKVETSTLHSRADSRWVSVPLLGMPAQVYNDLTDQKPLPRGWRSLEQLTAAYNVEHPLTGFKFGPVFSVRSLKQLLFTDHFFHHLERRRAEVHAVRCADHLGPCLTWKLRSQQHPIHALGASHCHDALAPSPPGKFLLNPHFAESASEHDLPEVLLGTSKAEADLVEGARSTLGVDLQKELDRFSFNEDTALVTRSQVAGCDMTLPRRFVKAPAWSYTVRRAQHPCYTTSNASYGLKNPKPADMPLAWNGVKGEFTKHSEGATRDKGLRCFTAMSKVHKRFDEYTHYR